MPPKNMKIVFVTPEMAPFAKTGGLADVTGTLPRELRRLGNEVFCFLPKYKKIDPSRWPFKVEVDRFRIPMGSEMELGRVFSYDDPSGVRVFLIDQPEYFSRDELYGTPLGDYPDNDRRFVFFQRGVLEALKALRLKPDILHCHDWQTGLVPVYLKTLYAKDSLFNKTKTVFTIHNLAYQGNFPPDSLPLTGLSWDEFRLERLEFYGKVSFLKGGLVYSDKLTTVSPRYVLETQSKEYGCGMEGVLQFRRADRTVPDEQAANRRLTNRRRDDYVGIINGIDPEEWNPEKDPELPAPFSARDLKGKAVNKAGLQQENHLKEEARTPLFGMITRLADQKGLDILAPAMEGLMKRGIQFVLLGTGEEKYHELFRSLMKIYPGQLAAHLKFDARLAKRIYAASDVFLMPSRYEPCGLGQLISFRYGTVPLVRETGGLADTVVNFDPKSGEGNGFVFKEYETKAFLEAVDRTLRAYGDPKVWTQLVKNGMKCDFSWQSSAKQYVELYQKTERRPVTV